MCGIVGFFDVQGRRRIDGRRLGEMRDAMVHRGPDDAGLYLSPDGAVGLANRRLSIIDLSPSGHQPMGDETGRVWITFNGEVYNYRELRRELEAEGYGFRSETDTEVVLRAYQAWGDAALQRLNGMWALAVFDEPRRRLLISRDRLGIKPLYYAWDGGMLVFASEIKPILASGVLGRPEPDSSAVADYVASGVADGAEQTLFRGIVRLMPGHAMTVSATGLALTRYWALTAAKREVAEREAVEQLRALFEDSVRLQMRSDVPIGVCLSGGLDSSSIFAALSRLSGQRIRAFTCFYEGEEYDERAFAREVADAFGGELFLTTASTRDLVGTLTRILWYLEEPCAHMGVFSQWHVMDLARGRVKVLLDGQGGDELLAGYWWYYPEYLRSLADALWDRPSMDGARRLVSEWWQIAARTGQLHGPGWLAARAAHLARRVTGQQDGDSGAAGLDPAYSRRRNGRDREAPAFDGRLDRALYRSVFGSVLQGLLREEDKVAMAHSIENRVPFLDHRLVEYAFSLPESLKIRDGWTKYVLRKGMSGVLPERIAWRRDKKGFPTPFRRWIREEEPAIREVLLDPGAVRRGILQPTVVSRTLDDHVAGRTDASRRVWRWLSLELWLRTFIDGDGVQTEPPAREAASRT